MPEQVVFISYSRRDTEYVGRLVTFLQAHHVPAWADSAINYGDHWEDVICQQIDACAAFVPVMTPNAWASPWVRNEVARARAKEKPILPLLLEGEIFFGLSHLETEQVTKGQLPRPEFVDRLKALVGESAGSGDSAVRYPAPGEGDPERRRPRPAWLLPVVAAVAVLLVVGTIVAVTARKGTVASPGTTRTSESIVDSNRSPGPARSSASGEPAVVERLNVPPRIGALTLMYNSPTPSTVNKANGLGYQIHNKTANISLAYQDPENLTRTATIIATTGSVTDPNLANIANDYLVNTDEATRAPASTGRLSGVARCGTNTDNDYVQCAWVDPGSIGVVVFADRPQAECATLLGQIRDAILSRE